MAERLPSLDDLDLDSRRALIRSDLNVPIEDGRISDDLRVRASVPTIEAVLERGGRAIVCSHLGRPKGKVVENLRMAPVGECLADLIDRDITAVPDITGEKAQTAADSDAPIVLLENLRFDPGEEANDAEFAAGLAALADVYVNDAFGSSHRAHASVVGVAGRLPSAAGFLLAEEVDKLERLLRDPERPFVVVLGGAKVSDKLGVIDHLLERVDAMVIGGAMAFTLLRARGKQVGRSLIEDDRVDEVAKVLDRAQIAKVEILLPTDVIAAAGAEEGSPHETVPLDSIGDRMGVDIGPESAAAFAAVVEDARTVLWNGPMGIFEIADYAAGTRAVASAVVGATERGAYTVVGGGDSAAALRQLGMEEKVSHLSTGGGASLELLEGRELPGIAALRRKEAT
jgi:phosphoglycerate kinase